ncbi:MAG: hypothetical protein Q4C83_01520 [Candidatus Saccharibacteria bacterium]|nr:hypothetical protein [Candidatus Saccharibacteria bacterium]
MNGDNHINNYGSPAVAPMQVTTKKRSTAKVIVWIVGAIVLTFLVTFGSLAFARWRQVANCEDSLVIYRQQLAELEQAVDDSKTAAKVTIDDVESDDEDLVNDFQSQYKAAKKLLNDDLTTSQCRSNAPNRELAELTFNLQTASAGIEEILTSYGNDAGDVLIANQTKLLNDAKSALNSTILSAQTLSQNQSLNASTKTQLNRAVATAQMIADSDDLENITSARDQLDDIIDQINESISSTSAALLDIEQKVSAIVSTPDANGDYTSSAVQIINAAGLKEVWGFNSMRSYCAITNEQASSWLAAFCTGTPNLVYISDQASSSTTHDSYFADAMRHEVAHYLIYKRCGTPSPASIGSQANSESVASSYAVLYLGANANTLNRAADNRYHMSQASDEAAARIHAGQCR